MASASLGGLCCEQAGEWVGVREKLGEGNKQQLVGVYRDELLVDTASSDKRRSASPGETHLARTAGGGLPQIQLEPLWAERMVKARAWGQVETSQPAPRWPLLTGLQSLAGKECLRPVGVARTGDTAAKSPEESWPLASPPAGSRSGQQMSFLPPP